MYLLFKDGKAKVVTLSYDDGVATDAKLIEIMLKHGLKGTFNINTGLFFPEDRERSKPTERLKLSEAKELYIQSGNELAIHGLHHPFLEQLNASEAVYQIAEDRKNLERVFGTIARGMAYPYGTYSSQVIDILKCCGICYSRTVKSTESFLLPDDWLALNPTCHHNNGRLMELAKRFVETKFSGGGKMFYLWGHSYEFDNDNNWVVIEEFCEYIGNREDIWYATNIEIYNYVKAYESLITSFDGKLICNPSAIDVWASIDGKTVMIPAGKTLVNGDIVSEQKFTC